MDPLVVIGVGAAFLALFLWSKKSAAKAADDGGDGDGTTEDRRNPGGVDADIGIKVEIPKTGEMLILPVPRAAGSTPDTAITSDKIPPGFHGYVRIQSGDTLSRIAKLASPLSGAPLTWRGIRDHEENAWCKAQTPTDALEYFGLMLVQTYGAQLGVDCELTPGWRARRYSHNTGIFPVLRVG